MALLLLLFLCSCMRTNGDGASVNSDLQTSDPFSSTKSVLWIGAHPDDEIGTAPLLEELCVRRKAACTLLVLTQGEKGNCKIAGGCAPDLATVRQAELNAAAVRFGANVVHFDLGDGTANTKESVLLSWASRVGGEAALVNKVAKVINDFQVDTVLTFDPRHGTTCHPDHMATAALAIVAAQSSGLPENSIFMVEQKPITGQTQNGSAWAGFTNIQPLDPAISTLNYSQYWNATIDLLSLYKSQYYATEVAAVSLAPKEFRNTSVLTVDKVITEDPNYKGLCP